MTLKLPRLRRGSEIVNAGRAPSEPFALLWDRAMTALEDSFNGLQAAVEAIAAAQAAANAAQVAADAAQVAADAAQAAADAALAEAGENRNPLSPVAFPDFITGTRVGAGAVTTDVAEVTVLDGTAPYTYAWATVSGDSIHIAIDSPTASSTSITASHSTAPQTRAGLIKCTVTDSSTPVRTGVIGVQYETTST
jgi:hypothetical protein